MAFQKRLYSVIHLYDSGIQVHVKGISKAITLTWAGATVYVICNLLLLYGQYFDLC
jgi:hypothetical protein